MNINNKKIIFFMLSFVSTTLLNAVQLEQDMQKPPYFLPALIVSAPYFAFLDMFNKARISRSSVPYTILHGYLIGLATGLVPLLTPITVDRSTEEISEHIKGLKLLEKHFPERISFGRTVYTPILLTSIVAGTLTGFALWYKLISCYLRNR